MQPNHVSDTKVSAQINAILEYLSTSVEWRGTAPRQGSVDALLLLHTGDASITSHALPEVCSEWAEYTEFGTILLNISKFC